MATFALKLGDRTNGRVVMADDSSFRTYDLYNNSLTSSGGRAFPERCAPLQEKCIWTKCKVQC